MSDQSNSFINEVTEDLRRERMFALFKRYGWIAIVLVLVLVAGIIWREWSGHRAESVAQQWGDAVLAAEAAGDPAAIAAVDSAGSDRRDAVAGLLAAAGWTEADQQSEAAAALRAVIAQGTSDPVLGDLARLKLVMVEGDAMEPSERDTILTDLSRAGAPFELLALEQKVVALVGAGRNEDAATLIRQIQQRDGLSEGLRRRLSEMMITLGFEPETGDTASNG